MTTTTATVAVPVRLDVDTHAAAFSKAMTHLDNVATRQLDDVGFDPGLRVLLRLRASQINGCAYCVDAHSRDARAAGESEQRVAAVAVWSEAPFFTARERAAFAFTESVTLWPTRTFPPRPTTRSPSTTSRTRSPPCWLSS